MNGNVIVFTSTGAGVVEDGSWIEVAYALNTPSNPQNALWPHMKDADDRPVIAVSPGSRVAVTSSNNRLTVDAEMDGPSFTSPSPAHNGATVNRNQVVSVDITDALSGVDKTSVELYFVTGNNNLSTANPESADKSDTTNYNKDLKVEDITGGVRASIALDKVGTHVNIPANDTTTVRWYAKAKDKAGNEASSDAGSNANPSGGTATTGAADAYEFSVDNEKPVLRDAYTGDWFNPGRGSDGGVEGDRLVGAANTWLPGASRNDSVRVVFNEALDGSTVEAEDFTVDGVAPLQANWYSKGDAGVPEPATDQAKAANNDYWMDRSVFLTVAPMDSDATPVVVLTGSVSDKGGNAATSGTKTARDGIAPSPTLSVDSALSKEKVVVTVETDERIRTLSPTLELYVANVTGSTDGSGIPLATSALGRDLYEVDTFTVGREVANDATSNLVLRDGDNNILMTGDAENIDKHGTGADDTLTITLSKAPILDRTGEGRLDTNDVITGGADGGRVSVNALDDAKSGKVKIKITHDDGLENGDTFTLNYYGTDPDRANNLSGVPTAPAGKQVSSTSWTFDLSIDRNDRYAARAIAEDANRNQGAGGMMDPASPTATVFEIDSELAMGSAATTTPAHDQAGANPVSIKDPFFIDLEWTDETNEYPGDSSTAVNLTKAMLDGENVLGMATVLNNDRSWRLVIAGITLGDHTLVYNAADALGNTYVSDKSLKFKVKPAPTWDLRINTGLNLISLPSAPADSDINVLFDGLDQITLVYTFEGAQAQIAVRDPGTGLFIGALERIESGKAYWVRADRSATVKVNIPPADFRSILPSIPVKGNQWNLVPVINIGEVDDAVNGSAPGRKLDADAYLGSFSVGYSWTGNTWQRLTPDPTTGDGGSDPPGAPGRRPRQQVRGSGQGLLGLVRRRHRPDPLTPPHPSPHGRTTKTPQEGPR